MSILGIFKREPVANSGTSDGATEGWRTRRAGALASSAKADVASNKANGTTQGGTPETHKDAEFLHLAAKVEHEKLAKNAPDTEQSAIHEQFAREHQESALSHKSQAESDYRHTPRLPSDYTAARDSFKSASQELRKAQAAYRSRSIGDAEFLSVRKKFDAASDAFDKAEAKVKNSGTSEGAKNGWVTRKGGASPDQPHKLTVTSMKAPNEVQESTTTHPNKADAEAMASLHQKDGKDTMIEPAEDAHTYQTGQAAKHEAVAKEHASMAKLHRESASFKEPGSAGHKYQTAKAEEFEKNAAESASMAKLHTAASEEHKKESSDSIKAPLNKFSDAPDIVGYLKNSGTSDGAVAGWETRRGGASEAAPANVLQGKQRIDGLIRDAMASQTDKEKAHHDTFVKQLTKDDLKDKATVDSLSDGGYDLHAKRAFAAKQQGKPELHEFFSDKAREKLNQHSAVSNAGTSDGAVKGWASRNHSVNGIELSENPHSPGAPGEKSIVGGRVFGSGKHEVEIHPDINTLTGEQNGRFYAHVAHKNGQYEMSGSRIGVESAKAAASEMHKKIHGNVKNSGTSDGAKLGWETRKNGSVTDHLGVATQSKIRARESTGSEQVKHAENASRAAESASEAADKAGTKAAHYGAAEAHVQAAAAHTYANDNKPTSPETMATATKVGVHQSAVDKHTKAAKAVLPPESPETIKTALDAQGAGHNDLATKMMHETNLQKPAAQYTHQDYATAVDRVRKERADASTARMAQVKAGGGYMPHDPMPTRKEYLDAHSQLGGTVEKDRSGEDTVYKPMGSHKAYAHVPVTLKDGPSKGKTVMFQATPEPFYDPVEKRSKDRLAMVRYVKPVD